MFKFHWNTWNRLKQLSRVTVLLAVGFSSVFAASVATAQSTVNGESTNPAVKEVTVTLNGGFEIGRNDYGRPVTLIASMLGVTPDVFRQAFSGVTPAHGGGPTEAQAQSNKAALMRVLAPYGVTNEKMDQVANYYRFNRSKGEWWPHTKATAVAIVENGKITGFKVITGGSGYSTVPKVVVAGFPTIKTIATVTYTTDFRTNGYISAITLVK